MQGFTTQDGFLSLYPRNAYAKEARTLLAKGKADALACRRAGPEAWREFRASQKDLLGRQTLDGNVVVLVNRLGRAKLPTTGR